MKTINRIAKKSREYLATLALGTALVSSMGYQNAPADEYLPITEGTRTAIAESVRKEISEAEREYTNALTTARSDFNNALVKRNFTLDAQRQVYTNLAKARSLSQKILASYRLNYKGSLESEDGRTFTALTEGDSRLYSLITNSLAGNSHDLEATLELEGLNVNVERAPKLTNAPVLAKAAATNTISYANQKDISSVRPYKPYQEIQAGKTNSLTSEEAIALRKAKREDILAQIENHKVNLINQVNLSESKEQHKHSLRCVAGLSALVAGIIGIGAFIESAKTNMKINRY